VKSGVHRGVTVEAGGVQRWRAMTAETLGLGEQPRRWKRRCQASSRAAEPVEDDLKTEGDSVSTGVPSSLPDDDSVHQQEPKRSGRRAASDALSITKPRSVTSSRMRSVCVVGGGPSGLGCCRVLCDAGLDVTLVQESRGLGGKLCTKYVNGKDDPRLHFDMGVQLLRLQGQLKDALPEEAVAPWPSPGRFKRIRCKGGWDNWKIAAVSDISTDGCVVGVPSMSTIGHHLADLCGGLDIHVDRTARVCGRSPKTGKWEVAWERGEPTRSQLHSRPELKDVPNEKGQGEFDAVVLAFEANKIMRGCKSGYKMTAPSATPMIRNRVQKAKTCQLWNLMVAFDSEISMPWDAAMVEDHPSIAWVAVDSSKPMRARSPQCFMVFSTREWANWKQWGKREVEKALFEEFRWFLKAVTGKDAPSKPSFLMAGRWGNSTETVLTGDAPTGEFPARAIGFHENDAGVVWDDESRMGATGDWARGFSACDAYAAGCELGSAMVSGNGCA